MINVFLPPMRRLAGWTAWGAAVACGPLHAAHPLQTEDTGTQGDGNVEIENGLAWARSGPVASFVYQPQVSYGLGNAADLILQPSWRRERQEGQPTRRGAGDTNLDMKWRWPGDDPLSFGVRAGLTLPTADRGLGIPGGKLAPHLLLIASYQEARFTAHANLGLASNRNPGQRQVLPGVAAAGMWTASERLTLVLDGTAGPDPDPARRTWPANLLAGAIYGLRPGLDLDLGYLHSLRSASPSREWRAGLTYRFTP